MASIKRKTEASERTFSLSQIRDAVECNYIENQSRKLISKLKSSANNNHADGFDYDLQAELERRFQELFGKPATK